MSNEEKKFPCESYEYLAIDKASLRSHMKSVHEEKKFPCEACNYIASYESRLRTHMKSVHQHQGKTFPCESCDYSFPNFQLNYTTQSR